MLLNKLVKTVKEPELPTINELPENYVKTLLDRQDSIPERSRAATYDKHVHVSSLSSDFCPRQYAIARHENLQLYETISGGSKVTFKIGRAVEEHIRENLIQAHGKKNVFAKWVCECQENPDFAEKGTYRVGLWKPALCKCGKPLDNFAEPSITDDENGVKGRSDLILYYKKTLHITEIKSIKKNTTTTPGWDDIEEPLSSHIRQNVHYPPLLRKMGYPVSSYVTFVYCTKDWTFGSPYKTFKVDLSDPKYEQMRQEMLAEAKQLKDWTEGGPSPPRICKSEHGSFAKKCPVSFRCFNVYKDEIK